MALRLKLLTPEFSVLRLSSDEAVPESIYKSAFYTISKSENELSVLAESKYTTGHPKVNHGWRLIRIEGSLDFSLTGIIASIVKPLAENEISTIAVTTYDTGYFGVKSSELDRAIQLLRAAGHKI